MPTSRQHGRTVVLGALLACGAAALTPSAWAAQPATASAVPVAASGSGFITGLGLLLLVVIVVAVGWWFFLGCAQRSRQRERFSQTATKYSSAGSAPSASIADLRSQAGSLLISTDDVITHAEQELAFAQAQFGEDQIRPFHVAIGEAKAHMRRSFQLQNQLDDDIPDTEEDQRSWLNEIIAGCRSAQESLKHHENNFSSLRQLERRAPEALESLRQAVDDVRGSLPEARENYASLNQDFAPTAIESVSDNPNEAEDRLEFAGHMADQAADLLHAGGSSEAVVKIRSGEEAVGQARELIAAILHAREDLERADRALAEATAQAKTDLAETSSLLERGTFADLAGSSASVASVVEEIEKARSLGPIDPLVLSRRLAESRQELDKGLESIRSQNERDRAARETLAHTMLSAQARLTSAADYVRVRRGGIQSEARTRLHEAERHLDEAEALRTSDPSGALNHANQSIRLAEDAQRIALGDVQNFSRDSYAHHGGYGSAALGGIFLGLPGQRAFPGNPNNSAGFGGATPPGFGGGITGQGF